jgi:hypothetical protein
LTETGLYHLNCFPVARERLAAGQGFLDLQVQAPAASSDVVALPPGALPIPEVMTW